MIIYGSVTLSFKYSRERQDMKKYIIGIDIGGTKVASGIIDTSGKLIKSVVLPTLAEKGRDTSMEQVFNSVDLLLSKSKVTRKNIKGIGVCAPGPLDPIKGIVHNPPNLPGWKEVPLVDLLRKRFKFTVRLENDGNAAGMAETVWGAAKGFKYVFYVTVSTGIGTGIIIDGKIYHGKNGMAGEGGHVTVNFDDKDAVCGCGNTGCIEAIASGPHTVRRLKSKLGKPSRVKTKIIDLVDGDLDAITMRTIAEAAKKKDKLALETIKKQGEVLGIWLGSMINVIDPDIIVIGGGVSMIGELIFREIRKSAHRHTINIFASKTPIVQAKLKKNVGIYGAASVLMEK